MPNSALLEAIATAVLDSTTVTFGPSEADDGLPTGIVIHVRHDRHGRVYDNATAIGLTDLSLSGRADTMLADAVLDTMAPVVHAALDDDETGDLCAVAEEPDPVAGVPAWSGATTG